MGARPEHDLRRDAWLAARDIAVLRIAANELASIDETADAIIRMAADRLAP
jgi:very-short-patch-repair endonuclease